MAIGERRESEMGGCYDVVAGVGDTRIGELGDDGSVLRPCKEGIDHGITVSPHHLPHRTGKMMTDSLTDATRPTRAAATSGGCDTKNA